jgi:hypothetical protein
MIVVNMGSAIAHWLGFQEKIGRSFMMNEDALKYPLSDYLVNEGNIDIKSIELERPHPNFSNRLVDLAILDTTRNSLNNLFELKLATSHTRQQKERQRIFNDIIRLYLAHSVTKDKCYFLITGKSVNFQRDFKDLSLNGSSFYKKWFAFAKGQTVTFDVATETAPDYLLIYQNFLSKYRNNYQGNGTSTLQLPTQITTTCEFVTAYKKQYVPYMAAIWSVK